LEEPERRGVPDHPLSRMMTAARDGVSAPSLKKSPVFAVAVLVLVSF
jgi:hypothetical protein